MEQLTQRQQAFVEKYVESNNARGAALSAGYSKAVADSATREVLGSDAVRQAVSELRRETQEKTAELLAGKSLRAAEIILALAEDESVPSSVRLRAAVEVIERGGVVELGRFEDRQADLRNFLLDCADA